MTDKPLTKCRRCGGRLEKQWSATGFQFVGSGWYVTDYAAKKVDAKSEGKEEKKITAAQEATTSSKDKPASKESKTKEGKASESKTGESKTTSSSNTSGD
jgi:predicted nucleic acid-binding Zn ribbon protein